MLGELNTTQIDNLLLSQVIGRLACCEDQQPYIIPVTYAYDGKHIIGQTSEGMKLDIIRKNPFVCFEVDQMLDMANWQSVIISGKFEELEGKVADQARDYLLNRVMPLMTSATIHPHEHEVKSKIKDSTRIKPVIYRITILKKTGRFEKRD
ncbi:MAG TPA: pyridoxamine 5'-phosphate oxidase family protein [Chitinophagaceae bacterium]|jgi:nitroimidazol reductase NimA-like FMN-containing flavoprotein (pyridoxamine 5'-phosphate oxidase superfamily)|nr:pyridoxamine 5'-phosphate oxidase family protein [Chitinophagaceae bacterium]